MVINKSDNMSFMGEGDPENTHFMDGLVDPYKEDDYQEFEPTVEQWTRIRGAVKDLDGFDINDQTRLSVSFLDESMPLDMNRYPNDLRTLRKELCYPLITDQEGTGVLEDLTARTMIEQRASSILENGGVINTTEELDLAWSLFNHSLLSENTLISIGMTINDLLKNSSYKDEDNLKAARMKLNELNESRRDPNRGMVVFDSETNRARSLTEKESEFRESEIQMAREIHALLTKFVSSKVLPS